MRFGILGAVEVWDAVGSPISVGGPRVRGLLALLLLNAGKVVPAELLIDGLYGDEPPAGAANALQSQVSRLRRGLRGLAEVELLPAGYRLAVPPDQVDAHRFLRLVAEAAAEAPAGKAALLDEALGLWRGPALADVPKAQAQAVRFEEVRVTALEDRAEAGLALGGHRDLVVPLRELVEAHPLRERPRALLMRALYGSGRQSESLELFEQTRQMLADELGTDPSAELAAVRLAILRAEPEPTAPAAEPAQTRLPAQLTSFVGRDDELDRISSLLADARLVTLLGPGGAGKTRLSIEVGGRASGEAVFTDLAAVAAGSGQATLARSAMSALGLREAGVLPSGEQLEPLERLQAALGDRAMLLILDNCEHVIADAAPFAQRLLASCPGLRILATSREALSITGETLSPVRQLAVPSPRDPLARAVAAPAVRLFSDRAAAAQPGFAVTADNLEDVIRICEELDGQPLAIELAAARLRALTVTEVAERLGDRFRLLSRGDRTKSPRHQTLHAVVEWSWDLLSPEEQELARRLTVFTGEFTPEAVREVCDGDEYLLLDLADKSLVQRTASGRYRMLQTIAAYCSEERDSAGEEPSLRRAHASYYLSFALDADTHLRSADQVTWLERLDDDQDNLHAALRWAVEADVDLALRFVGALSGYWWLRGVRSEGAAAGQTLLAGLGTVPPPDLDEEYVLCVANVALGGADVPALPALLAKGDELLNRIDRPLRQPFLHAMWALAAGPPEGYEANAEQILQTRAAQFGAAPWTRALIDMGTAYLHLFGGRPHQAEPALTRALARYSELGERWGMTQTLDGLATLAQRSGDPQRALDLLDEALRLVRELGSLADTAEILERRADILVRTGSLDEARASYLASADLARRSGAQDALVSVHRGLGDIARLEGDLDEAQSRYTRSLDACPPRWYATELRARNLLGLAHVAHARGDTATARAHAAEAASAASTYPPNPELTTEAESLLARLTHLGDDLIRTGD